MSSQYDFEEVLNNRNNAIVDEEEIEELLRNDILQRPEIRSFFSTGQRLQFDMLSDDMSLNLFRFTHQQLIYVSRVMGLQERIYFRTNDVSHRFSLDRVFALGIMLRRLAYPNRLPDLQMLFGIHQTTIDVVFNDMIEMMYETFEKGIRFNKKHLNRFNIQVFAEAIKAKNSE